jgi:hypothetical protein
MAYGSTQLSILADANGFTHWRYDTLDTHATVDSDGYFTGEAVNMLKVGDLIDVFVWSSAIRSGTISTYGPHVVLTNDGSTVDVTDVTVGVMTDTD